MTKQLPNIWYYSLIIVANFAANKPNFLSLEGTDPKAPRTADNPFYFVWKVQLVGNQNVNYYIKHIWPIFNEKYWMWPVYGILCVIRKIATNKHFDYSLLDTGPVPGYQLGQIWSNLFVYWGPECVQNAGIRCLWPFRCCFDGGVSHGILNI